MLDEPLQDETSISETDTESNIDEVSSGDTSGEISPEQSESVDEASVDEAYSEQVIEQLTVMNELGAKIYCCNLIIIALFVFLFVYQLIKNNITRHFV